MDKNGIISEIAKRASQGKSLEKIAKELGLFPEQVNRFLRDLRSSGYTISLNAVNKNGIIFPQEAGAPNRIYTSNDHIKFLCISDTHLGCIYQRQDALDAMINYCINNNIHIILHCGDLVDGCFGKSEKISADPYYQITNAINTYPQANGIVTFLIGGDHDDMLKYDFDLLNAIYFKRPDIIPIDYSSGYIDLLRNPGDPSCSTIQMYHFNADMKDIQADKGVPLVLKGHYHKMGFHPDTNDNCVTLDIPTLSDIFYESGFPGMCVIELQLDKNNQFSYVGAEALIYNDGKFWNSSTYTHPIKR